MDFLKFFKTPIFGVVLFLFISVIGLFNYSFGLKGQLVAAQQQEKQARFVNELMLEQVNALKKSNKNTIDLYNRSQEQKEKINEVFSVVTKNNKNEIDKINKKYENIVKTPEVEKKIEVEKSFAKMSGLHQLQCSLEQTCK